MFLCRRAELAAALVSELMNYSGQHRAVQCCAMQRSPDYLREALQLWLAAGEKIIIPHRIMTF